MSENEKKAGAASLWFMLLALLLTLIADGVLVYSWLR